MTALTLHRLRLAALLLLPALAAFPIPAHAQAASVAWGTYLGGAGTDFISAVAQSPTNGDVVVVGNTTSQDFPPRTATGTLSARDAFVHIFTANGTNGANGGGHVFGGASTEDLATTVAIGPTGLIFVGGLTATSSFTEFPSPVLSYKAAEDGFLACFAPDGNPLWLLYLGSTGLDVVTGVTVSDNDVYVAGYTASGSTFLDGVGNSLGGVEGFVVKVDVSSGSPRVLWHTLISGTGDDFPQSITLDGAGGVLVEGYSTSPLFPSSMTPPHGARDALVAKLKAADGTLSWVNLLGGADQDEGRGIITTQNGQVVVVGVTINGLSNKDGFVTRLDSEGHELGTQLFGGHADEEVGGVASDVYGNLYISGSTNSQDFPLDKAFDQTIESGTSAREGFVVMLPAAGSSKLGWASFLGGNDMDTLNGLSIRSGSRLIVVGQTSSSTGLFSTSPYDSTLATPADGFIMALDITDVTPPLGGNVYDRPQEDTVHEDLPNQKSTSFLAANWEAFTDFESTIVGYECAFGTAPGLEDVSLFTPNTPPLKTSCSTQQFLTPGVTYYVTVRATSSAGLTATASSNGVLVGDLPSPDGGTDGGTDGGVDGGTDGGTGNTDGGTDEPPPGAGEDKALLGWSCAAAEAGPLVLVSLLALFMLARQRGGSSR